MGLFSNIAGAVQQGFRFVSGRSEANNAADVKAGAIAGAEQKATDAETTAVANQDEETIRRNLSGD